MGFFAIVGIVTTLVFSAIGVVTVVAAVWFAWDEA